jgi:hypothetical protein
MTEAAYTSLPLKVFLNALFEHLQAGLNRHQARAVLSNALESMLENGRGEVTPPLPRAWRLVPQGEGLDLATDAAYDAAQAFIRLINPTAAPMAWRREWHAIREAVKRAAHDTAANPQAAGSAPDQTESTATNEEQAIAWLAARLKKDDSVRKADVLPACCKEFGISMRQALAHIWPAARTRRGLSKRAPAGIKPGSKRKDRRAQSKRPLRLKT